jgi:hypothetical protein
MCFLAQVGKYIKFSYYRNFSYKLYYKVKVPLIFYLYACFIYYNNLTSYKILLLMCFGINIKM